jgi:hypothetical protein
MLLNGEKRRAGSEIADIPDPAQVRQRFYAVNLFQFM